VSVLKHRIWGTGIKWMCGDVDLPITHPFFEQQQHQLTTATFFTYKQIINFKCQGRYSQEIRDGVHPLRSFVISVLSHFGPFFEDRTEMCEISKSLLLKYRLNGSHQLPTRHSINILFLGYRQLLLQKYMCLKTTQYKISLRCIKIIMFLKFYFAGVIFALAGADLGCRTWCLKDAVNFPYFRSMWIV